MALLFLDSFDHYQTPDILSKWTSNFTLAAIGIGTGRCGSNCLQMGTYNDIIKGLPFASARGTVGFAYRMDSQYTLAGAVFSFAQVGNVNANHLGLQSNGDGSLSVYQAKSGGITLGLTGPGLLDWDHWYFIEWQMLIHPTAGEVIVRVNNVPVIAVSGVNTATTDGDPILRRISFHCSSNQSWKLDDLYVLDDTGPAPQSTFLGDCRVEYLRPASPGAFQQWPTVVGSSGDHWLAVDDVDVPDRDETYVESNTPGEKDTNRYRQTGLPSGPIFGAQLSLFARKTEIGPRTIAPVVNGVIGPPSYSPSFETYQYWHTPYGSNPATGLPWTIAEINSAEFGVTVVS